MQGWCGFFGEISCSCRLSRSRVRHAIPNRTIAMASRSTHTPGVPEAALGERTSATYVVLREWIVSGQLAPGSEISQLELTRRLGVSRTPLREALRLLTADGLVLETEAHRRVSISSLSMSELDSIYAMRIPLAAMALWLTVPRLTVADLVELRHDAEAIESPDLLIARDAHRRYHACLEKYAGDRMRETLYRLMLHSERYQQAFVNHTKAGRRLKYDEHSDVIKACEKGDRAAARDIMVRHLASTALSLMAKNRFVPVSLPMAMKMAAQLGMDEHEIQLYTPDKNRIRRRDAVSQ
jgi:DNA-binding GntR family transcriptional regulator